MNDSLRPWLGSCLFGALVAAACGTVKVPFEPPPDGAGGSGGSGAAGGSGGSTSTGGETSGGAAGASTGGQLGEDGGSANVGGLGGMQNVEVLVEAASRVWGVAATETDVYWTEWGTNDELDNYLYNGTLNRMDIESRDRAIVAEGLGAPVSLQITTTDAYMLLKRNRVNEIEVGRDFGRVALAGGSFETLESNVVYHFPPPMGSFEDRAYVAFKVTHLWKVLEFATGQAPREVTSTLQLFDLDADAAHVYYTDSDGWLVREVLDGSAGPEVLAAGTSALVLDGDRMLTIGGSASDSYIAEVPLEGGTWVNVQRIGDGLGCSDLVIVGERYAASCSTSGSGTSLVTGLLGDDTDPQIFPLPEESVWAISEHYAVIAAENTVYGVALD